MATTKQTNKKAINVFDGVYHAAVGRRKTAIAQVRVYCDDKNTNHAIIVNGKDFSDYFTTSAQKDHVLEPLKVSGLHEKCGVSIFVKGGGLSGQSDAAKLGIARALIKYDEELRPALKADGLLTRDARKVERKKPGLRKARRSPQWSKR